VLGPAATEQVITAWAEAYGFLAEILIGREKQIYSTHERTRNGWLGFKPFRVVRTVPESEIITSFYLQPSDGSAVPLFKPGQYITVRIPDDRGQTTMRNYSLSNPPGEDFFRISVKQEPKGFVSTFLHRSAKEGTEIETGPPCGEFFIDLTEKHERPLMLLSAGVGVTPLLSMLLGVLKTQPEREVFFVHGALNGRVHAFRDFVRQLAASHPNLKVHYRYNEAMPKTVRCDGMIVKGSSTLNCSKICCPTAMRTITSAVRSHLWSTSTIIFLNGAFRPHRFTSSSLGHAKSSKPGSLSLAQQLMHRQLSPLRIEHDDSFGGCSNKLLVSKPPQHARERLAGNV